jgi:ubiquitin carboxyl-terminal hydrolase 25/28
LIANHRNSQALRNFLETGTLGEVEMDVDTAYALLDIHDKAVEDDLILTTYNVRISDNPSQLDSLKNAVTVIAKARNSRRLGDFVNTGMISSEYELSEWPVGLENIGNTCYLNSLLQFYFTIKPLRDLVMNIDEFKMPVDEESLRSKRVGSRIVSKKEVTRAQQCK